jgi:hypothetical protein
MASSVPAAACGHIDALAVTCLNASCVDSACLVCAREGFEEAPDAGTEGRPQPREFEAWWQCEFCADWACAACANVDFMMCGYCDCFSCSTCSRVQFCPARQIRLCLLCSEEECGKCFKFLTYDYARECGYCGKIWCEDCDMGGYWCETCPDLKFSCDDCECVRPCACEAVCLCADHSKVCSCGESWLCDECQKIKCGICMKLVCQSCQYDCSFCEDVKFCAECTGDGFLCDFCSKYGCSTCRQVRPCSSCNKFVCKDEAYVCGERWLCSRVACMCACTTCASERERESD